MVSLAVDNEDQIRAIAARLTALGVSHRLIIEEDGQAMAIGIEPTADLTSLRKAVSALPLVK